MHTFSYRHSIYYGSDLVQNDVATKSIKPLRLNLSAEGHILYIKTPIQKHYKFRNVHIKNIATLSGQVTFMTPQNLTHPQVTLLCVIHFFQQYFPCK